MSRSPYTEATLTQQPAADLLRHALGWEVVSAWNNEDFGPHSLLGRNSAREVVLQRTLRERLEALNPGLPEAAYEEALRLVTAVSAAQDLAAANRDKHGMIREGVQVGYRNAKGEPVHQRLRLMDFDQPDNNHFLCVQELWVQGELYRRRADMVCFVNGLPLLFMEFKAIGKSLQVAYEKNLADYKETIPHLFHHNELVVLANGSDAKLGTVTSRFAHFCEWKRLAEDEPGAVDMATLLKGICRKDNLLDLVENFIVFDESAGVPRKIVARNHQFLGVNRAIAAVRQRQALGGKLGVFWHTQGSGKSYSMVFFTRKVHRKLGGQFTFLILTDRDDLDSQIYKTFAGCGVVNNDTDPCRAASGEHLAQLLRQHKTHVFSLIQKFNQQLPEGAAWSQRDDIVVISDEAHRTQYGTLALNMRQALPNASAIGFTGTPLFKDDEITRRVFGEYVSTYDFQRAVEDNATVPLYYDARGERLGIATGDLNERLAKKLEALEESGSGDLDVQQRLERELKRDYHIYTAQKRLDAVARDFVQHYATAWESGKAMLVCIDKITCVRMYNLIQDHWRAHVEKLEQEAQKASDEQHVQFLRRQMDWMRQTQMAVVVSEEQGEAERFRQWGLDITPHRRLMKEGMELPEAMRRDSRFSSMQRLPLDDAFKAEDHPFRIAIVCAMWLTGFDVPSLATLYLDKPLKAHTLMQAIARANRVHEGKNNGLIVDYCGILRNLRQALATFAGRGDGGRDGAQGSLDPTRPQEELLAELGEAIALVRQFLEERSASLAAIIQQEGFARNRAILAAKEAANENDAARKRFEIMCRAVFAKFKACLTLEGIAAHRQDYEAINIIYKSLQQDREQADIGSIIRALHAVVDEAITPQPDLGGEATLYDISKINFERLRQEFAKSPAKHTTVQNLRAVVEQRLQRLLAQNPLRTDFQAHYEKIIAAYNRELDRATIEATFEALLKFVEEMDQECQRAAREGLDEESLAVFDLLKKSNLQAAEIQRIKAVAAALLATLKEKVRRIDHWRDKEASRDDIRLTIRDYLWNEATGLPTERYSDEDVDEKAEAVFLHALRAYPAVPSPVYA